MTSNYKKIGNYIRLVDVRNTQLEVKILLGLSITKEFIPSVANTVGTNMANYKIIKKGQFSCSLMQVRRDKKIPVALQSELDEAIISQAYPVFEIIDAEKLNPEYLMMWMSRSEFDRHACFLAIGGVRGSLEWDDFCDMEIPVPSIKTQCEIVREYNVVNDRITLNDQLSQKLEDTAQAVYKQWFVDFEFPISKEYAESIEKSALEGEPYKSSGGEMEYCEELEKDFPLGWSYGLFNQLIKLQSGYAFKSFEFAKSGLRKIIKIKNITPPTISLEESMFFDGELTPKLSKYEASSGDLLISMTGSTANQMNSAVGQVGRYLLNYPSLMNQRVGKLTLLEVGISSEFCYQFISCVETHLELLAGSTGSANQANISPMQIESLKLVLPTAGAMSDYDCIAVPIVEHLSLIRQENSKLEELKTIINIKMSKA